MAKESTTARLRNNLLSAQAKFHRIDSIYQNYVDAGGDPWATSSASPGAIAITRGIALDQWRLRIKDMVEWLERHPEQREDGDPTEVPNRRKWRAEYGE